MKILKLEVPHYDENVPDAKVTVTFENLDELKVFMAWFDRTRSAAKKQITGKPQDRIIRSG
jgi:hypothetical protein